MPHSERDLLPFSELSPFEQRIKLLTQRRGRTRSTLVPTGPGGLSKDTVSNWCRKAAAGKKIERNDQLHLFCQLLGISEDWLLGSEPLREDSDIPKAVPVQIDQLEGRRLIAAALVGAGVESGLASDVALKLSFDDLDGLARAIAARLSEAGWAAPTRRAARTARKMVKGYAQKSLEGGGRRERDHAGK